jgi:hypothetical protein
MRQKSLIQRHPTSISKLTLKQTQTLLLPNRSSTTSSPTGNGEFFLEVGVPVPTRKTPTPRFDKEKMVEFLKKVKAVALKYRTELLEKA